MVDGVLEGVRLLGDGVIEWGCGSGVVGWGDRVMI